MNKNKILIELSIPLIEKNYDLYIPINKKCKQKILIV